MKPALTQRARQLITKRNALVAAQLGLALLLLVGVWVLLPARYWLVDSIATLLALAALAAGVGLALGRSWSRKLARVIVWSELIVGTLTVSALALSASQLAGSYGPVGAGGALLMLTVSLLVLPYLIALPVLQLAWLREPG